MSLSHMNCVPGRSPQRTAHLHILTSERSRDAGGPVAPWPAPGPANQFPNAGFGCGRIPGMASLPASRLHLHRLHQHRAGSFQLGLPGPQVPGPLGRSPQAAGPRVGPPEVSVHWRGVQFSSDSRGRQLSGCVLCPAGSYFYFSVDGPGRLLFFLDFYC